MRSVSLLLLGVLLFALLVNSSETESTDDDSFPADLHSADVDGFGVVYDFIVVGAGACGSVVAARLANETDKRILLLEGGAWGTGQRAVGGTDYVAADFKTDPITGEQSLDVPLTRYDIISYADSIRSAADVLKNIYNITAIGPFFSHAKVIGGNQATNGGAWYYPTNIDFNRWGIPGFFAPAMRVIIKRLENATDTGFGSNPTRGNSGPNNIRFGTFYPRELIKYVNASTAAGYSYAGDVNDGVIEEGIYFTQQNSRVGIRDSTSVTYLAKVLGKSNLDFRTSAIVTRVLFLGNIAIGVEYVNKFGFKRKVYALKEVILSAGTLQTTKILYNSGIGPESVLTAFGKPHRVVNEIIGQKIRNHQRATMTFTDPDIINPNFFAYPGLFNQYARTGTGAVDRGSANIYMKLDPTAPYNYPETTALPYATSGATSNNPYAQLFTVTVTLNQNLGANATLNLTSPDPLAPTIYRANTFLVDHDPERIALGFLEVRRVMQYWNGSITEISPGSNYTTVEELVQWIRANPGTACHYNSATPMGTDPSSPTTPRMKVRGVQRLRIVDVSVVPNIVTGGMQGLAVLLGEKGTDLIKQDHGL